MTVFDSPGLLAALDNPALTALTGPHAHLANRRGRVLCYPSDVTSFVGMPEEPDEEDWRDVAALVGPGGAVGFAAVSVRPPSDWEILFRAKGVQMTGEDLVDLADEEARPLGPADVPEMLDLVARTRPGPFLSGGIRLGDYLGIRRGGALVAMAGERLHPPGWTEISAVCTDPAHRGQGLSTRLIRAVAAGIRARGEQPFLHAASDNTGAIRLYESLGFRLHRTTMFAVARVPRAQPPVV